MHSITDPYDELGVDRNATEREIKDAFRRLAALWHPDRNTSPDAAERMARINRAYRQLTQGEEPQAAAAPAPEPAEEPEAPRRSGRSWWNRDWSRARWEPDGLIPPKTIRHEASISLEQAAFGCRYRIKGIVGDLCHTCQGVGRLVSRRSDCRLCRGEGRFKLAGAAGGWQACDSCFGDGSERKPCEDCEGRGLVKDMRTYYFDVHIPAAVRDGQTVVLRGQGQKGIDGARGDIDVGIKVKRHAFFGFDEKRRLTCELPVDLFSMLAGAKIEIPNLDGKMTPLDLSQGAMQLLEGQGYPKRNGTRGPLVVQLRCVTPQHYSPSQQELLRQLSDDLRANGYEQDAELGNWQRLVDAWRAESEQQAA